MPVGNPLNEKKKKKKRIHYIQLGRPAPGTVTLLDIPRVFSIGDDNTRISYFRDPPNLSALLRISWFLHPPICLLIDTWESSGEN